MVYTSYGKKRLKNKSRFIQIRNPHVIIESKTNYK